MALNIKKSIISEATTTTSNLYFNNNPESKLDFLNLTEPLQPRLDLDNDLKPKTKEHRNAVQLSVRISLSSDSDLDLPLSPKHQKSAPLSPVESMRTLLGRGISPKKILGQFKTKHKSRPDDLLQLSYGNKENFKSLRYSMQSEQMLHLPIEFKMEKANSEGYTVARPHSADEKTQDKLFGFHVRKSCYALSSTDFDTLLFDHEDVTLKLSLTPDWIHSNR